MEFLRSIQSDLMLFLSGVCAALSILVLISDSIPPKRRWSLLVMELVSMILLISDRYAYIFRGDDSNVGYIMVRLCNFVVFFASIFEVFGFNLYLKNMFTDDGKKGEYPRALRIVDVILAAAAAMLIVSQYTGFYYTFDEHNYYHRESGMIVCYMMPLLALMIQLVVIIKRRRSISKKMFPAIMLFAVVPLTATVVQMFTYGLSLTNLTIVGMAMLLYVFSLSDMNDKVKTATEKEIAILRDEQENMQEMFEQTALALANAIDAKDKYTHGHSRRVAEYSRMLAEHSGKSPDECREIYYTALLHDVGKIGVPDHIINKEGRLTDEEFDAIKQHPSIGDQILSSISSSPQLSIGAHFHHERYDGKGYPDKLKGDDIPEIARIISVADAYDAMTSKRSYRDPLPQQLVREEIVKGMGTQFDPEYAKIMLHLIDMDLEYKMKENAEVKELAGRSELKCDEFRSDFSSGIQLLRSESHIHIRSTADKGHISKGSVPTMLIFDSLDARVHYNDRNAKTLHYFEYAEIRLDGEVKCLGAREYRVDIKNEDGLTDEKLLEAYEHGLEYDINVIKYKDHLKFTVTTELYAYEVIIALPDSARFAYISFTGENCLIDDFRMEKTGFTADDKAIERIAPEVSYIEGPGGNIPNIQIDGWRTASTRGEPLFDKMELAFHYMSLPTARLIWHCPFIVLFTSDNGRIGGENYRELALIRFDGECWDAEDNIRNRMQVSKNEDFVSWDSWRERNKQGVDTLVEIIRDGGRIVTKIDVGGMTLNNTTTIENEEIPKIYVSITGDQCAVTNIWIKS